MDLLLMVGERLAQAHCGYDGTINSAEIWGKAAVRMLERCRMRGDSDSPRRAISLEAMLRRNPSENPLEMPE